MSKASRKRTNSRRRWLRSVADKRPEIFSTVWAHRLESWVGDAQLHRNANELLDEYGRPSRPIFRLVDKALEELAMIGHDVYHAHSASTRRYLMERCCRAVADTVDRRLYPQGHWPVDEAVHRRANATRAEKAGSEKRGKEQKWTTLSAV